jgi:hypothetical protein
MVEQSRTRGPHVWMAHGQTYPINARQRRRNLAVASWVMALPCPNKFSGWSVKDEDASFVTAAHQSRLTETARQSCKCVWRHCQMP